MLAAVPAAALPAHAVERGVRVVLEFAAGGEPAACDFTVVTLHFDRLTGRCRRSWATMPALDNLVYRVKASEMTLRGTVLRGWLRVYVRWPEGRDTVTYHYAVDAAVDGPGAKGTFRVSEVVPGRRGEAPELSGTVTGRLGDRAPPAPDTAFAPGTDWPCWRGPESNGSAAPCGRELVDSLAEARLVWASDEVVPDSYTSDSRSPPRGELDTIAGGYAAPLAVGGRVYLYYYVPHGRVAAEAVADRHLKAGATGREKWFIDADDVIHCLDARTGRTLWKTAFSGKGMNVSGGFNKGGGLLSPCWARGRVYALGSGGRVYCVDAGRGEPVWEADLGARTESLDHYRRQCRAQRAIPYFNRDMGSAVAEADGVVVCNDHVEHYRGPRGRGGNGLVGFDAETGRRLWSVSQCAEWWSCPLRWVHKGRAYIVCVGGARGAVCVEPATGRVLWQLGEQAGGSSLALAEDYLVCDGGRQAGMTCFRISPDNAVRAWSLGKDYGMAAAHPAIYNGHLYAIHWSHRRLICVELATGRIVAGAPGGMGYASLLAADGRVLGDGLSLFNADAADFRALGGHWPVSHANSTTPAIADGRLFLRSRDGLLCYDLRKSPARPDAPVAKLIRAAKGRDVRLAAAALVALARLGEAAAADLAAALDEARRTGNATLFGLLGSAVWKMGPQARQAAVPVLLKAVAGGSARLLAPAVRLLLSGEATARAVVPALAGLLKGQDRRLWEQAAEAMVAAGPDGAAQAVGVLLGHLRADDVETVVAAAGVLGRVAAQVPAGEARQAAVRGLASLMGSLDRGVRKAAIEALGSLGPQAEPAATAIEEALSEPRLYDAAAAALRKIRPDRPVRVKPKLDDLPELEGLE